MPGRRLVVLSPGLVFGQGRWVDDTTFMRVLGFIESTGMPSFLLHSEEVFPSVAPLRRLGVVLHRLEQSC